MAPESPNPFSIVYSLLHNVLPFVKMVYKFSGLNTFRLGFLLFLCEIPVCMHNKSFLLSICLLSI